MPNQPTPLAPQPQKSVQREAIPARLAAIAGCAWFVIHGLRVILGSERTLMQWLYDDAFYYMIAAKHLSEQHLSSFDGVTLTTGYHPLWLWLCAVVYGLHGHLDLTYVRSCMALAFCISSAVLGFALRHAWTGRRNGMLWAIGLGASSYSALNNGLTAMEWPLVLLFWFLLHIALVEERDNAHWLGPLLLGIAGTLSRTDFGLIPAAYLAAALVIALRSQGSWNPARRAFAATVGSAAGLPIVFLYNHRMTGSWLQSSAEVKHLAASLATPFNPMPALWQFLRVLLYLPPLDLTPDVKDKLVRQGFSAALILALAAAAWITYRWRTRPKVPDALQPADRFPFLAALIGIAAYLILDGFNTQATYGWYTGAVTGFILILAARFLDKLKTRTAAAIVLPLMIANIAAAQFFGGNAVTQMQEVYIGKAMHLQHPNAVMGGGDVGKPAFYNNGTMFNLDGLMNNEVVPYLGSGRIHCYILHRHIAYLSDVGTVTKPITDAERARHGEAPLPWTLYFTPVAGPIIDDSPRGASNYLQTNFDAIRASGECPTQP